MGKTCKQCDSMVLCAMQKTALRTSLDVLRNCDTQAPAISALESLLTGLKLTECEPYAYLLERIKFCRSTLNAITESTYDNQLSWKLTYAQKSAIKILGDEIETFLNHQEESTP